MFKRNHMSVDQPLDQQSFLIQVKCLLITALAAAVCVFGGCGKKPATAADGSNTRVEPAQGPSAVASVPRPAPTPPPAPVNAPRVVPLAVAESADASTQLAQLTQVLRRYGMERQRVPQSLNELITAGYLTMLPPAPAGKQFSIDTKRMQVVLANR